MTEEDIKADLEKRIQKDYDRIMESIDLCKSMLGETLDYNDIIAAISMYKLMSELNRTLEIYNNHFYDEEKIRLKEAIDSKLTYNEKFLSDTIKNKIYN